MLIFRKEVGFNRGYIAFSNCYDQKQLLPWGAWNGPY